MKEEGQKKFTVWILPLAVSANKHCPGLDIAVRYENHVHARLRNLHN